MSSATDVWPALPLDEWRETYATVHMMTQIVGKVRLACVPMLNHWWQATLYLTARGLTTSVLPHGARSFQLDFDFVEHVLSMRTSDGQQRDVALCARPIAEFYHEVLAALGALSVPVRIWPQPVECADPIRFDRDDRHTAYDPEYVRRWWDVLRRAGHVLTQFRAGFIGKCSPVHFFWGSFDLAVTRFSGRRAPEHPGGVPNVADHVTRAAYSHECSSCGFWPGGGSLPEPIFYAYTYPEPAGYANYPIRPAEGYYHSELREHILPYEAVRRAADPQRMLQDFFQSTYEAGAVLGGWDRAALETV